MLFINSCLMVYTQYKSQTSAHLAAQIIVLVRVGDSNKRQKPRSVSAYV